MFGRFEILELIGIGGKGHVYKARDLVLDNVIALKVLARFSFEDKRSLMRFQSEARIASKLSHPNIAAIYDFGISDSVPYISMEYVEGQSLRKLLDTEKTLSLPVFTEVFKQVCIGLACAHSHEIVHRDIKPENIVLAQGTLDLKILDFGAAKRLDISTEDARLTPTGDMVGSPLYMSPEQCSGQQVTSKSDAYALGCVMYECLAGQPPFIGDSAMETLIQHQHKQPEEIERLNGDQHLPPQLISLISRLLAKSPDLRPDLTMEVLPLLDSLESTGYGFDENSSSGLSRSGGVLHNGVKSDGRRRWALPVVLLLLAAIAVLAILCAFGGLKRTAKSAKLIHSNLLITKQEIKNHEDDDPSKFITGTKLVIRGVCDDAMLERVLSRPNLPKIDFVSLDNSSNTDLSFNHLAKIKDLTRLELSGTDVQTLAGAERLTSLQLLNLSKTGVNDDALDHILNLPINDLNLKGTSITKAGLEKLSRLKTLQYLNLTTTRFEHDWVPAIAKLSSSLRGVWLGSTSVNRNDLVTLSRLRHLDSIGIAECRELTAKEIDKVRKDNPALNLTPFDSIEAQLFNQATAKLLAGSDNTAVIRMYMKCRKLLTDRYEPRGSEVLIRLVGRGDEAKSKSETKLAEKLYLTALKLIGPNELLLEIWTLKKLCEFYTDTGNDVAAKRYYMRLRRDVESHYGKMSGEYAEVNRCLGPVLVRLGEEDVALEMYRERLRIFEKFHGRRSINAAFARILVADLLRQSGKPERAKKEYQEIFEILQKLPLADDQVVVQINVCLTLGGMQTGTDRSKALEWNQRAYKLSDGIKVPKETSEMMELQRAKLLSTK